MLFKRSRPANKHVKRCSTSLVLRERKSKPQVLSPHAQKTQKITSAGEDGETGTVHSAGGNVKGSATVENSTEVPNENQKWNSHMTKQPHLGAQTPKN